MFYTASKYFVVVLCVLLCSGCLLDRLVGSKKELCADRIELGEVTEEGASIIFIKPILWNSDIIKIIGEKPTRIIPEFITPQSKKLEYHYRIVREGDDPQGEYASIPFFISKRMKTSSNWQGLISIKISKTFCLLT